MTRPQSLPCHKHPAVLLLTCKSSLPEQHLPQFKEPMVCCKQQHALVSPCRSPSLPEEYLPQFKESVKKAGLKWEDFKVTDNSCGPHPEPKGLLAKVGTQPAGVQVLLRLPLY